MSAELELAIPADRGSHSLAADVPTSSGTAHDKGSRPACLKVLVAIASYGSNNDAYLRRLIKEYRSMQHDVDIVVLSNISKPLPEEVELRVGLPSTNPWSLPFAHKAVFVERQDDYDLFIYSEDDTLLTQSHIDAFLEVSKKLRPDELAGFIRTEEGPDGKLYYSTIHRHYHWDPASVCERGGELFAYLTNEHGACYLLTRPQLKQAIKSGGFAVPPHEGKYDMLVSAATDPYTQCGLKKLVCISRLVDFACSHLTNKYVGRTGTERCLVDVQIKALLDIAGSGERIPEPIPVETKDRDPRWAKSYYEPRMDEVIDYFVSRGAASVLSLGCGSGETEVGLMAAGIEVTAVPLDIVIGRVAASRGVEVIPVSLEEAATRLEQRRFDGLLMSNILHLMHDPFRVIDAYSRLLSDNGGAVICSPNCCHIAARLRPWLEIWRSHSLALRDAGAPRLSIRKVCIWLESGGMGVAEITYRVDERWRAYDRVSLGLLRQQWASHFCVKAEKGAANCERRSMTVSQGGH